MNTTENINGSENTQEDADKIFDEISLMFALNNWKLHSDFSGVSPKGTAGENIRRLHQKQQRKNPKKK